MERVSSRIWAVALTFLLVVAFMPLAPSWALADETANGDDADLAGATDDSQVSVAITSELTTSTTLFEVSHANVPDGAKLYIERYAAGVEIVRGYGDTVFNSNTASWFKFSENGANNVFIGGTMALRPGDRVVAYILGSDWSELAVSAPATVPDDSPAPTLTRQEIIDACSVSMTSPHADGDAAGKFVLSDTEAEVSFTLHESVEYARIVVYAYPKAATFSPDNVSYNKPLFNMQVRGGDEPIDGPITATFGDKLAALDTTYNLVADMYFLVPNTSGTGSSDDYQHVTSRPFTLVDENGQTTESYTFPKASITDDELVAGSTAMHVSLAGDERLFQLAEKTKDNALSKRFTINYLVVEYDADVDYFDLDADGYGYTTLYSEEATSAFSSKEIELKEPLTVGKKVRALCYWSQYSGEDAALPVPKGVDYAGKDAEALIVQEGDAPVLVSPTVSIAGQITTASTSFNMNVRNLTEGQIAFVCKYGKDEQITYRNSNSIALFTGYNSPKPVNGANAVSVAAGTLSEGDRIVAFVLSNGDVVAQSEPVVVAAAPTTQGKISITSAVSSSSDKVTVHITDMPEGAAVLVKTYALGTTEFKTDKGTPHGYNVGVHAGDNELALQTSAGALQDGYLVAFLMKSGDVVAQSEPVAISYTAAPPEVSIGLEGDDVALTQGDKFVGMRWSVDPTTTNASYKVYQFTGDVLNEATAEVVGQGTLVVSKTNRSGNMGVSIGGESRLKANAKLQVVLTADGQKAFSNVMTVGATPEWAKVTPTITFDQNAVKADAETVKLIVSYPEEYATELGDQFYCNVVVYQYPGTYTDEDFEKQELDEKPEIASIVTGRNAKDGVTNGAIELTIPSSVALAPGNRLVAKVRLPQAERQDRDSMWEDYLSWSIPVIAADAEAPVETIWLYNLGADTEKGAKLRKVASDLGLTVKEFSAKDLNERVGFLIGREGYEATAQPFDGKAPSIEFMLMDGLSEASLDRLLAACKEAGVSVGAKGITTDTNVTWTLARLIGDIADEHELMTTRDELSKLVKNAKALDAAEFDTSMNAWSELQGAIATADKVLALDEDTAGGEDKLLEASKDAFDKLQSALDGVQATKKSGTKKGDDPAGTNEPGEKKRDDAPAAEDSGNAKGNEPASAEVDGSTKRDGAVESDSSATRGMGANTGNESGASSAASASDSASMASTGDSLGLAVTVALVATACAAALLAFARRRNMGQ